MLTNLSPKDLRQKKPKFIVTKKLDKKNNLEHYGQK